MLDKPTLEIHYVMGEGRLKKLVEIIQHNGMYGVDDESNTLNLGNGSEMELIASDLGIENIKYYGRTGVEFVYYPIWQKLVVENLRKETHVGGYVRTFDTIVDIVLKNYSK